MNHPTAVNTAARQAIRLIAAAQVDVGLADDTVDADVAAAVTANMARLTAAGTEFTAMQEAAVAYLGLHGPPGSA